MAKMAALSDLLFDSPEQEVKFLRGMIRLIRITDELIEDCLAKQLGLSAALDVLLAQAMRMLHADGGFIQLLGTDGPVLSRKYGRMPLPLEKWAEGGTTRMDAERTLFVARLDLKDLPLGALGLIIPGRFREGFAHVQALVDAVAEQIDSTLLGFLALSEGASPLERLDELSARTAFRPHGRMGRYQLLSPLGTGGMGQVMVARTVGPEGVGRLVAIKRILPHLCADPETLHQFLDEARIGLRLDHPNLVRFYDFGEVGGAYYIAMELVRGIDLGRLLDATGPLPPPLVSAVIGQALQGLAAAHALNGEDGAALHLVHRDLSPSNLMVGFDGRVKVLDFGVAKIRTSHTVTVVGMVKGKPLYMSPEQAVGEHLDARSDLFSVGLVLYEALTGRCAFRKEQDIDTMQAIVDEEISRPKEIPATLWKVIDRALKKNPEERFPDAEAMAAALTAAVKPASEAEVGREVVLHFPEPLRELRVLEREAEPEDITQMKTQLRPALATGSPGRRKPA